MLDGEVYVLQAVLDTIRTKLSLKPEQCDCEYDEKIPAMAGDLYVAVLPAGTEAGPAHNSSGGVIDALHAVKITVFKRCKNEASDRIRNVFLDQMAGVNKLLSDIMYAIDWQQDVMVLSNHLLWNAYPNSPPFIEMLRATSIDSKPRMVTSEVYGAQPGKGYVAMARSVVFGKCRRMQTVSQTR